VPDTRLAKERVYGYAAQATLNAIRTNRTLRLVTLIVTFAGWFVLSNHCALGRMTPPPNKNEAHGCCENGSSQPAEDPPDGKQGMECCKSLHAVLPADAKLPVSSSMESMALPVACMIFAASLPELCAAAPATGPPPDVPAFAELVLHRSLHSHAPPPLA
jgi:hypothetical protein